MAKREQRVRLAKPAHLTNMQKLLEQWMNNQDSKNSNEIVRRVRKYWSAHNRKEFVAELIFNMDYSNDELVTLANEIGRLAHERERVLDTIKRENMPV